MHGKGKEERYHRLFASGLVEGGFFTLLNSLAVDNLPATSHQPTHRILKLQATATQCHLL